LPVTREHVWPDWLRRREEIEELLPHVQLLQRSLEEPERREWPARPFKMTVRAVCRSCNTGWMGDLEHKAGQLLGGMLDGRGRALHQEGQRTLSLWALKTALMFEQAAPRDARVIPHEHYEALCKTGEPAIGTKVWLASYDASQVGFTHVIAAEVTALGQSVRDERNVYVRTFTVGSVAFQVFGTTNPALYDMVVEWGSSNVHSIWPRQGSIVWMPRPAMTDSDLLAFSESTMRELASRALAFEP
jgi:hypothetical protein